MVVQLAVRTKRMKFNIQYLKSSTVGPSVIKTAYIDYLLDFFSGGGRGVHAYSKLNLLVF